VRLVEADLDDMAGLDIVEVIEFRRFEFEGQIMQRDLIYGCRC